MIASAHSAAAAAVVASAAASQQASSGRKSIPPGHPKVISKREFCSLSLGSFWLWGLQGENYHPI